MTDKNDIMTFALVITLALVTISFIIDEGLLEKKREKEITGAFVALLVFGTLSLMLDALYSWSH